jgi:hypothetical protein
MRIIEIENARLFDNGEINGSFETRNMVVDDISVEFIILLIHSDLIVPNVVEPF